MKHGRPFGKQLFLTRVASHTACTMPRSDSRKLNECDLCRCAFDEKEDLERHKRKYHAETPKPCFVCTMCAKGYARKNSVARPRHFSNVHEKNKDKLCDICDTRVGQNCQCHRKSHQLPDGSYYHGTKCPECQWSSNNSRSFKRHVNLCYKKN